MKTLPLRENMLAKGNMLVRYLTVATGLPKRRPVLRLLQHCIGLQRLLAGVADGRPFGRVGARTLVFNLEEDRAAARLLKEINHLLTPYTFSRSIARYLLVDEGGHPTLQTHTAVIHPVPFSKEERGSTIEQTAAVELVLDLAEQGELDRVRRCRQCRSWYMADRTDQRYCKNGAGKCIKEQYRASHKTKLKDYMREYRMKKRLLRLKKQLSGTRLSEKPKLKVTIARLEAEFKALRSKTKGTAHGKK